MLKWGFFDWQHCKKPFWENHQHWKPLKTAPPIDQTLSSGPNKIAGSFFAIVQATILNGGYWLT